MFLIQVHSWERERERKGGGGGERQRWSERKRGLQVGGWSKAVNWREKVLSRRSGEDAQSSGKWLYLFTWIYYGRKEECIYRVHKHWRSNCCLFYFTTVFFVVVFKPFSGLPHLLLLSLPLPLSALVRNRSHTMSCEWEESVRKREGRQHNTCTHTHVGT